MLGLLKRLMGWNRQSELQKHRLCAACATLVCWLPISLPMLLRLTGSGKHQRNGHQYGHAYSRVFARFRYRRIKPLEIGIGGGQSLTAWQAYFPRATIVACNIINKPELATLSTRICQLDQSDAGELGTLQQREGRFDIIIDDGSHFSRDQILVERRQGDSGWRSDYLGWQGDPARPSGAAADET
jgi:hypothetical protein